MNTQEKRTFFFQQLLRKIENNNGTHVGISTPQHDNWIAKTSHISGVLYLYRIKRKSAAVELYLDPVSNLNFTAQNMYDFLTSKRQGLEAKFQEPLIWEKKSNVRVRKIVSNIESGGYEDVDKFSEIHKEMINKMEKIIAFFKEYPSEVFESFADNYSQS